MSLKVSISILVSLLTGFAAQAEVKLSSNFAVATDYVWRGVTQSNRGPAVQGGMDIEESVGVINLSAGIWISSVEFSAKKDIEADFYAKAGYAITDDIGISLGGILYHYPRASQHGTQDTMEYSLGFDLWMFSLSGNYTDNYFGTKTASTYVNLSTGFDLIENLGLSLSVGSTSYEDESKVTDKGFIDYKVQLDHVKDDFTTGIFFTNTNRETRLGVEYTDRVFGFIASRSF